ncbi:MAG: Na+/H+ antiporter subunit E [Phycisphaerales bacterium JB043]
MMRAFLFNIALALTWTLLTGSFSEWNFVAGMLVGAGVVEAYLRSLQARSYFGKMLRLLRFGAYFFRILVQANLQVAWEVLTPRMYMKPRILRYPVGGLSDVERTTLANCITLTPGTLVIDESPDRQWLYVHCMYAEDADEALRDLDELAYRLRQGVFS